MLLLPFKKILCPTDFSPCSYLALRNAVELATELKAELCLVHVVSPIPRPPISTTSEGEQQVYEPRLAEYERLLHASAEQKLRDVILQQVPPAIASRAIVTHGDAAIEIVRIAEDERVGLIVISTHGMSGWRSVAFGSTAERVVRLATRPVLSIRAPCGDAAGD
jgi:nucleotide-binding universal stress UspA family protein